MWQRLSNDREYPIITRLFSTRLRKIVDAIVKPGRLRSIPRTVMAVLVIAITLGWVLFAYGQTTVIPFHTLFWGSAGSSSAQMVINDQATWSRVWMQFFTCSPSTCPPAPEVNFTSRTALAVLLGWEPTSGYAINISQVSRVGSNVLVNVQVTVPGPSCAEYEVRTAPSHIVDIPKTGLPVMFRTETSVRKC
jgi:hypothetical protein